MKRSIVVCAMCLILGNANAYELATHGEVTYQAYLRSNLTTNQQVLQNLGIDVFMADFYQDNYLKPLGDSYYDFQPNTLDNAMYTRYGRRFEHNIIDKALNKLPYSLHGWLMRGAIREDDSGYGLPALGLINIGVSEGDAAEPFDEPYSNINRWCNHFFDPTKQQNRGADFFCPLDASIKRDAATWALGVKEAILDNRADDVRRNHFSVLDAREAMFRAITGQAQNGGDVEPSVVGVANRLAMRKRYWATTFRALGDLVHLNQDMAQPQHTRNESHAGIGPNKSILGNPIYEKYTDAMVRLRSYVSADNSFMPLRNLTYQGYEIPNFDKYSDYWSTGDYVTGKGMADYSNRGFFTVGNNIGNSNYVMPNPNRNVYTQEMLTDYRPGYWTAYLTGTVQDTNDGSKTAQNVRLSRESAWHRYLLNFGGYTLDRNNFNAMQDLLIPRAVAYSAGLLNYFFRGRMEVSLPDEGVYSILDHAKITIAAGTQENNFNGFNEIKLKLSAPATDYRGLPQIFSGGKVIAVIKFKRNKLYKDDLTAYPPDVDNDTARTDEEEIITSGFANGGSLLTLSETPMLLTFTFNQALPINATDVRLQVVYRGKLGNEDDAVVVTTKNLSEPTFFSYMNASDYNIIAGQAYTRAQINNSAALLSQVYPQSCVDYTLETPQLKAGCLNPFNIKLGFLIGTGTKQIKIDMPSLAVRQFIRVVMLGDADSVISLAQKSDNTCYPHNPFQVTSLEWQDDVTDVNTLAVTTNYPLFSKIRGVSGWYATSCVGNADGSAPGSGDNRDEVMTANGVEVLPVAVTITPPLP